VSTIGRHNVLVLRKSEYNLIADELHLNGHRVAQTPGRNLAPLVGTRQRDFDRGVIIAVRNRFRVVSFHANCQRSVALFPYLNNVASPETATGAKYERNSENQLIAGHQASDHPITLLQVQVACLATNAVPNRLSELLGITEESLAEDSGQQS